MWLQLPEGAVPDWSDLRAELGIVEPFPPAVLAEAADAATSPDLPDLDRTDIELVTVDPPGSRDLDQAMALERLDRDTIRIHYAIADVAAFVEPGSALDAESRRRGSTIYAPDRRVPMLPPTLSEEAASLLAGQDRPAVLWTLDVDGAGELAAVDVRRALVRSRRQLTYDEVLDWELLRTVGERLEAAAADRGAVSLPVPEQRVELDGGRPHLSFRAPLPSESWNEQVSLLTGRAAAQLMLEGGVGLLRTMPAPDPDEVDALRRSALALDVPWPADAGYGEVISGLDPDDDASAAVLALAPRLLRGAGYTSFDGELPDQREHSAVGGPYAHCTAPLRRLADRFVSEVCLALCAGTQVPGWARAALPELPELMAGADRRAKAVDRAAIDLAEAIVLAPCVGEEFAATVVAVDQVQLLHPAVRAPLRADAPPVGERVTVRLVEAEPATRTVAFELAR